MGHAARRRDSSRRDPRPYASPRHDRQHQWAKRPAQRQAQGRDSRGRRAQGKRGFRELRPTSRVGRFTPAELGTIMPSLTHACFCGDIVITTALGGCSSAASTPGTSAKRVCLRIVLIRRSPRISTLRTRPRRNSSSSFRAGCQSDQYCNGPCRGRGYRRRSVGRCLGRQRKRRRRLEVQPRRDYETRYVVKRIAISRQRYHRLERRCIRC